MRPTYKTLFGYILISSVLVKAFEPITTTIVAGAGAAAAAGWNMYSYFYESCDSQWIDFNSTGLEVDLNRKLFGQHIVSRVVLKAITGFMKNKNPKKPLVLSLHGGTGTGKNFVSQLIAKNLYKKGTDSGFFHQFVATAHFPHQSQIENYKSQLQHWIKGNITNCPQSMFIFDEMDKMQPGLIDSIKPYLDYYEKLDGVSYRQAIFIFLSNSGGENIVQVALDFWKAGKDREEIELKDLEMALSLSVFNNKNSGFWHISLIDKNLVDFFVPFVPLEYKHLVQCGMAEMDAQGLVPNHTLVDQMVRDMVFFPKSEKIFSVTGCKTISNKLSYYGEHVFKQKTTADGAGAGVSAGWNIYSYFYESCDSQWIDFNSTGLEVDLNRKLFGQHIVSRVVLKAITGFMKNKNPKKPLVLSLHGGTGTGKNFVSQLIAKNLYKKGTDSGFFHQFVPTAHFPHQSQIENYKSQLQHWIKGNITNCPQSMFIFDEMDKMQPGLIDSIKPYLDYYEKLDGVFNRQAIFIFLSNSGGENYMQVALDFWRAGKDREEIELKDLETAFSLPGFNIKKNPIEFEQCNTEGGFWHSLIDKNLVDFFVPFLPLEYKHLVQCGMAEMDALGLVPNHTLVDQVVRVMTYFPKIEKIFSVTGCKTIRNYLYYYRKNV
uniref:AAA+ ATPase domain-containing protein n=1 Tax=Esox lucius TaxID=8010 RepID=A0A3P8XDM4_ESOLU